MEKYKVLKDWGDFKEGEVVDFSEPHDESLTPEAIAELVNNGTLELMPEPEVAGDKPVDEVQETIEPEVSEPEVAEDKVAEDKKLYFTDKLIISDTIREVEGKQLNHVTLEDGSQMDLTVEEYQAVLDAASK